MAILARVAPVGMQQSINQRGNNRQICFEKKGNIKAYLIFLL